MENSRCGCMAGFQDHLGGIVRLRPEDAAVLAAGKRRLNGFVWTTALQFVSLRANL